MRSAGIPLFDNALASLASANKVVYVQSIASFNAGLDDGTLSGGVYFTVSCSNS